MATELPIDVMVLGAALVAGGLGNLHCAAMCGGIAAGLGSHAGQGGAAYAALASNLGRVGGYIVMGAAAGGLGGGLLGALAVDGLAQALRAAVGLVLLWMAVRLAWPRWAARVTASTPGPVARGLAHLRARVPARGRSRPWLLGLLWGWLPCGLSLTVLSAAWLQADALHGALTMGAFGLGTLPVLTLIGWSGARLAAPQGLRYAGAGVVGLGGLLTLTAPWLAGVPALHGALAALGCRSL